MKRMMLAAVALVVVAAAPAFAQLPLFETPRVSPRASVTQRVGITDITVTYHRPAVGNRTIWGGLVPYDQVWRAGANENTTISFTHPVFIGDTQLDAGTYGLHVLAGEDEWTFIVSHQSEAWGSFSYDESEDAVRVTVAAVEIPHQEYLTYTFDDPARNEVALTLSWEMKAASLNIWVDTDELMVQRLRDGLRGLPRFNWRGWEQAASWCLQNDTNLDQAMDWIERSVNMNRNFTNLSVKSELLARRGESGAAQTLMAEAMALASEAELNTFGYRLMGRGQVDRAIDVFKTNVKSHPTSWNAHDSLAEAYMTSGDTKNAIKFYEKALSLVEDESQKSRIRAQIAQLKG